MRSEALVAFPDRFLIYLVRHATPDRSRSDIPYHTVPGPDLTPAGRQQAAELGEFLKSAGVAHLLCSPLERAWQTGSIASKICGATLELNQDLAEHRLDESPASVLERMERALLKAAQLSGGSDQNSPGDGENLSDEQIMKPVALVSHGSPVYFALKWLGMPLELLERYRIYDERTLIPMAGAWRIEKIGDDLHMELAYVPSGVKVLPGVVSV